MKNGQASLKLGHQWSDGCFVEGPDGAEGAVGYRDSRLQEMIDAAGLRVTQFHRGQWAGRKPFLTYQDVYVLKPV